MSQVTEVIMPVLGMSQDYGKLIRWIKQPGEWVEEGEPLMEVETDKATVEIEAPASGVLSQVSAKEGDDIPVTQVIAVIRDKDAPEAGLVTAPSPARPADPAPSAASSPPTVFLSPLAARIAAEHDLDPLKIKPGGGRIEKADVLDYLKRSNGVQDLAAGEPERLLASPKARRLAAERGIELAGIHGSGPQGAILAADVPEVEAVRPVATAPAAPAGDLQGAQIPVSQTWNRMVERISASWPVTPHFYLVKEVNATRLIAWRQSAQAHSDAKITFTDLLVRVVAAALKQHPRINAHYQDGKLMAGAGINVGLAVAVEDGLVVPVIHRADTLSISQISKTRTQLVERAQNGRLSLEDLQQGTFTISNLGMYGIDAFNAVINPPQAAILAVGRIADRVVALNGQPAVQPMMVLTASFDHRVVDGARGALFLKSLAEMIEEPLNLLD